MLFMPGCHRKNHRRQLGAAALEFAFLAPFLLLLIAGIVSLGRMLWYHDALAKATRDGARIMSMADLGDTAKRDAAVTAAQTAVTAAAAAAGLPDIPTASVDVRCGNPPGGNPSGDLPSGCDTATPTNVSVGIIDYTVPIGDLFPFMPYGDGGWSISSVPLKPKTTMRYMR